MSYNIAIDGPAGAGKSTIAKALAARLGFIYVDTGAMYRAMALYFIQQGIHADDEESVAASCNFIQISIEYQDGAQQVILNGDNVSDLIRTEQVGNMASSTSGYVPVREKLTELSRRLAKKMDVVMDGRDIGTCVLPDADVKIYLTASSQVRAMRRFKELEQKGVRCNLQEIEQDIIDRDHRDMHRTQAPLKQAGDAVLVDSSQMDPEQVLDKMMEIINERK